MGPSTHIGDLDHPDGSGSLIKCSIQERLMQHYSLGMWAVIQHTKDILFGWALCCGKCPRSFHLPSDIIQSWSSSQLLYYQGLFPMGNFQVVNTVDRLIFGSFCCRDVLIELPKFSFFLSGIFHNFGYFLTKIPLVRLRAICI